MKYNINKYKVTIMKTSIELIADERKRQVEVEGWTAEHDAAHKEEELALAAASYALPQYSRDALNRKYAKHHKDAPVTWPWLEVWWKPTPNDRIRELVKAGALIAAEIDRLQAK